MSTKKHVIHVMHVKPDGQGDGHVDTGTTPAPRVRGGKSTIPLMLLQQQGERVLHLSSHTGLMRVLPGHPLAHSRSSLDRIQHQEIMETHKAFVRNTAKETFAHTKAILVKPWPAAHNNEKKQATRSKSLATTNYA